MTSGGNGNRPGPPEGPRSVGNGGAGPPDIVDRSYALFRNSATGRSPERTRRRAGAPHSVLCSGGGRPRAHAWVWSGSSWRCLSCGTVWGAHNTSKCAVSVERSKINSRHLIRAGHTGDVLGSPLTVCTRCGGSHSGGRCLQEMCRGQHPGACRRLDLIAK